MKKLKDILEELQKLNLLKINIVRKEQITHQKKMTEKKT